MKLSRFFGRDSEMVIAGGGNTSGQVQRSSVGEGQRIVTRDDHARRLRRDGPAKLDHLLEQKLSTDRIEREAQFKSYVMAARGTPEKGRRPSVEAVLHHLMPASS